MPELDYRLALIGASAQLRAAAQAVESLFEARAELPKLIDAYRRTGKHESAVTAYADELCMSEAGLAQFLFSQLSGSELGKLFVNQGLRFISIHRPVAQHPNSSPGPRPVLRSEP